MPSLADFLAAYGGSPDPENPSSGQITPGLLLRAIQAADEQASKAVGQAAGGVRDLAAYPGDVYAGRQSYLPPGLRREDFTDIPPDQTPAKNLVGQVTGVAPHSWEPQDPQIQKTVDLGANLMGVGTGFAQPGSAGIFGGRLAKNAPLEKYAQADAMLKKGATREQVYDATGLTLGAEGQLKHEIPDYGTGFTELGKIAAEFTRPLPPAKLGEVYNHPGLYEAYPHLRDVQVRFEDPIPGSKSFGGIDKETNTLYINPKAFDPDYLAQFGLTENQIKKGVVPGLAGMRSTALHELQHMVQGEEGFAAGGNVWMPQVRNAADRALRESTKAAQAAYDDIIARRDAFVAERGGDPGSAKAFFHANPGLLDEAARLKYQIGTARNPYGLQAARQKAYESLAGETEARNVQYRRDMTPEELAATPPAATQDVPYGQQLLRFTDTQGNQIRGRTRPIADAPSFTERMGTARDVAFAGRQRGTGNILPRSTANEAPLLAPGETLGDLQGALTPGMAPAQKSIADIGRNTYRDRLFAQRPNVQLSAELPPEYDFLTGRRPDAPYPQFAEQYPATRRPTYLPAEKGGTYPAKTLTKEAEQFAATREKIIEDMRREGYQPFFDPSQRFPAQFEKQPGPHVDTAQALAARPETIAKHLETIGAPETLKNLREAYSRGLDLPDSQAWYFLGQLERKAIDSLGEEAGRKWFRDNYATGMATTTTGMTPQQNLIMAQYLNYLRTNKLPFPTASHQTPVTVGGQRTMPNIKAYQEAFSNPGGAYESLGLENPKRTDFAQAQMGNPNAFTMDEQMTSGMIGKDVPQKGTYGLLTNVGREEAQRSGVWPQRYQDVAWAGFKKMLEEASRKIKGFRPYGPSEGYQGKPMISEVNDMIERTHRLTGMPRQEIFERGFLRHEIPLYGVGGLTLGGVLMGQTQPAEPQ